MNSVFWSVWSTYDDDVMTLWRWHSIDPNETISGVIFACIMDEIWVVDERASPP